LKLHIICKGSPKLGLGHLTRAKTFAKVAAEKHHVCITAIIPKELECLFIKEKCEKKFVRNDLEVINKINAFCPDVLIFDLVDINESVFNRIKQNTALKVSLSPVFSLMKKVDLVFTRTKNVPDYPGVNFCSGLEYSIFNDTCTRISSSEYKKNLQQNFLSVAISMGGADASNKTLLVLRELVKIENDVTFWVILGEGYSHSYQELVDCTRENPNHEVLLAKTNRSMWRILRNCSLAVLSGGLTTVEAVYAGLPSINLFEKPEHIEAVSEVLFESGVCINGGLLSDNSHKYLIDKLVELDKNRNNLWKLHQKTRKLVDGEGPVRVLKAVEDELLNMRKRNGEL